MASRFAKWVAGTTLCATVFTSSALGIYANQSVHTVSSGDTLWKLSQRYNTTIEELSRLNPQIKNSQNLNVGDKVNVPAVISTYTVQKGDTPWIISNRFKVELNTLLSTNKLTASSEIYPGQVLRIPAGGQSTGGTYTVKKGDTPWTISNQFKVGLNDFLNVNGLKSSDSIYEGQVLRLPANSAPIQNSGGITNTNGNKKSFITHTVVRGDDLWKISIQYGIPFHELLSVNGLKEGHVINLGDKLTIPVYQIAVKATPGPQYGELLDWWIEAQYVVPIGKEFTVVDFSSGKRWRMKRTIGANHADCEPLTSNDAAIMKQVWGGSYSWNARAVIIEVDNRRIAASASSMPHDIQYITNNNFTGHSDIHFFNSTRHKDGLLDKSHQANILKAAGK